MQAYGAESKYRRAKLKRGAFSHHFMANVIIDWRYFPLFVVSMFVAVVVAFVAGITRGIKVQFIIICLHCIVSVKLKLEIAI